jgi:hypothetical protein
VPKNTQMSVVALNAQADALAALLDDGYLRIYGGRQPDSAEIYVTNQPLLAELRFSKESAPAAVGGELTFNKIADEPDAPATGRATWFRCFNADGRTAVMDGEIGRDGNLSLDDPDIVAGGRVSVHSFGHGIAGSTPGH